MFIRHINFRALLPGRMPVVFTQVAGFKDFEPPPVYPEIEFPERPKLRVLERAPQYPASMKPFKMQKRLRYMRGPEPTHTFFVHKQFGIIALGGGRLKYGHFEMIRNTLGKKIDTKRMFGMWRIDAPWQPVTCKGQGQRMGGGKGAIDHYVTPIKAGRVIIEVGGHCQYFEVKRLLEEIAAKLPFKAMALTHEMLEDMKNEEKRLEETNKNPWTMKYIIQNNIGGCHQWISPVDKMWFGKHR
ncbi:39S ribosomal protein L16, mitochondrial [Venturia canescens]|uniref:39S ribosomal protein L16, mitochondrial n=1 Tax=Venturia canescens TaxID=32260 RepID=UPI001C9C0F79|nr:39S ribosomal protein L16, mitochondrial [Venturia canescens]